MPKLCGLKWSHSIHSIFTDEQAGSGWGPMLTWSNKEADPFFALSPLLKTCLDLPLEIVLRNPPKIDLIYLNIDLWGCGGGLWIKPKTELGKNTLFLFVCMYTEMTW